MTAGAGQLFKPAAGSVGAGEEESGPRSPPASEIWVPL